MSKLEKIVLATRNQGKVKEFRALLAPLGIDVRSAADFPGLPEVIEDGNTFAENAVKKAGVISEALGCPALADDSGLCVDALNGRPGVFSARYAGENASDEENIKKLLQELHGVPEPERTARFVCVLALIVPGNEDIKAEGVCEGRIATEPKGENGFGYDPVFFLETHGCTMAELSAEEKNRISHRAAAMNKLQRILEKER